MLNADSVSLRTSGCLFQDKLFFTRLGADVVEVQAAAVGLVTAAVTPAAGHLSVEGFITAAPAGRLRDHCRDRLLSVKIYDQ